MRHCPCVKPRDTVHCGRLQCIVGDYSALWEITVHCWRLLAETGQCVCSVLRVVSGCNMFYDIRKLYSSD